MIHGNVRDLHATVKVVIRPSSGSSIEHEFVIDTGFEGALTMPSELVAELGLPFFEEIRAKLADDSSVRTVVHTAHIEFDGRPFEVAVLAMAGRPLLATSLLAGKELVSQFIDGGLVTIDDV